MTMFTRAHQTQRAPAVLQPFCHRQQLMECVPLALNSGAPKAHKRIGIIQCLIGALSTIQTFSFSNQCESWLKYEQFTNCTTVNIQGFINIACQTCDLYHFKSKHWQAWGNPLTVVPFQVTHYSDLKSSHEHWVRAVNSLRRWKYIHSKGRRRQFLIIFSRALSDDLSILALSTTPHSI